MITLRQLTLARGAKLLLEGVDLTLHAGQKIGVVGPNGCGKSSLFALLLGELHQEAGDLELPGRLIVAHVAQDIPESAQAAMKPLLGVPDDLSVVDIFCFGPPAKPPYKRWKKSMGQILSWDRFDPKQHLSLEQIDQWIHEMRHKVMYRDESKVD